MSQTSVSATGDMSKLAAFLTEAFQKYIKSVAN